MSTAVVYPRNGGVTTLKPTVWQGNSLGQDNDAAGFDPGTVSGTPTAAPPHPLYQPHYDRDFASVIELFNVPTWGPYGPASPTTMNVPGVSSGSSVSLASGLTHLMAHAHQRSRYRDYRSCRALIRRKSWPAATSCRTTPGPRGSTTTDTASPAIASNIQKGGGLTPPNPAADVTENRWHRLLGLVEVPTRSHRQLEEPPYQITAGTINGSLGFYRTPGKINLNTVRHPDVLAGLLDENDIYALCYSAPFPAGQNFPAGLSVPSLAAGSERGHRGQSSTPRRRHQHSRLVAAIHHGAGWGRSAPALRWAEPICRCRACRGIRRGIAHRTAASAPDAVPPGSHPFRGLGFSAYANAPLSTTGGEDTNPAITARSIRPSCGL